MCVNLNISEKIAYETRATGESTYLFFCRAYRDMNKKEPPVQLVIGHVKGFLKTGVPPGYVYSLFREAERRAA